MKSWELLEKDFWEILRNFSKVNSVPQKSVKLVTKSWEFHINFRRNTKIRKISDQFLRISQEFLEKYSREIFWRNSHKFLETKSQNSDSHKISEIRVQFPIISWEYPKSHKNLFSRNSPEILLSKSLKL